MNSEPLLYDKRPTPAQIRTTLLVALLTSAGFVATIPFWHLRLPRIDSFIPVLDTALFLGDIIIATLVLAQALVLRAKALVALGTGYFFTSLIVISYALTFPGAFSPSGLLGAGVSSTTWLYIFWHCGLPISVIGYVLLKNVRDWPYTASLSPRKVMFISLIAATILVGALTLLATIGQPLLPRLMLDRTNRYENHIFLAAIPVVAVNFVAMAMTWRNRTSILDLWLLFVLGAWLLELISSITVHARFELGWYSGRVLGLLSSLFVLLMFLAHTSRLYARAVLQVRARLWERENRLMVRDAMAACMGHELRQPLAAMMLNVQVAKRLVHKPEDLSVILDDVLADGDRANEIMQGMRSIFGKSATQKSRANINQLVRETLTMTSRELHHLGVSVDLQLDTSLQPIDVNRLQIEQVLFNLFMNAAEAMSAVVDRPRILTIRTASDDIGLLIRVEDTGPGIAAADQERIFDAFYTTKDQGTGLGLSICRSVITAHGGSLHVSARKPMGAIFEIRLPCHSTAEPVAQGKMPATV
jgi:signal transduction histidine kinase